MAYTWPSSMRFGVPHQRMVYMDLNHWIGLAKAGTGHRDGARYEPLLKLARALVASDAATFPLSAQHYMEMSAISDPCQRHDIASVMKELSSFRTLLCRSATMRLEVEAALDVHLRRDPAWWSPLEAIGTGFGHAFGINGKLRIGNSQGFEDVDVRSSWPGGPAANDALLDEMQLEGEWRILRGPLDDDLEQLAELGYMPDSARAIQVNRAQQEVEQVARFNEDPKWRRGRIRDVIRARYVAVELFEFLHEGLYSRDSTIDEIFPGNREVPRSFVDAMPSGDVHITLQVEAHRNPEAPWAPNDIFDIDALSIAVPFCDVVATDRRRARDLNTSGCAERLGTKVVSRPEELMAILEQI